MQMNILSEVLNLCEFCKTIYKSRRELINADADAEYSDREGIYEDNNKYHIYVGDEFEEQYGVLREVEYCPYCGVKLVR